MLFNDWNLVARSWLSQWIYELLRNSIDSWSWGFDSFVKKFCLDFKSHANFLQRVLWFFWTNATRLKFPCNLLNTVNFDLISGKGMRVCLLFCIKKQIKTCLSDLLQLASNSKTQLSTLNDCSSKFTHYLSLFDEQVQRWWVDALLNATA